MDVDGRIDGAKRDRRLRYSRSGCACQYPRSTDVWEFNPTTDQWTWVNGFSRGDTATVSQGVGAAGIPGSGIGMYWIDKTGTVWVWEGNGTETVNSTTYLWKYTSH